MGDETAPTEEVIEEPAAEAPEEPAAPDLEARVTDLEAAIIALGGADRVPTL